MTTTWSSLAIAATAVVLFGIGLVSCVIRLVKGNRDDLLASVPIAGEQRVTLASPGEVLVMIETPRTSTDYRAFQIQLVNQQTRQAHTVAYSLLTAQGTVYGVTRMKVPFGRVNADPGVYSARVTGLRADRDYSDYRLILSRPYMGRMALQIVGIVLCGVGMLLSVIWAAVGSATH